MNNSKAPTKIIERIQALLALASNNPSEAEAASAAEMAAKLMAQHHLDQAEIEAAGGEAEEDGIGGELIDEGQGGRNVDTWKRVLLFGIKKLFGVEVILQRGGSVTIFGRLSDVQTTKYVWAYLTREIVRLSEDYFRANPIGHKRSVTNDFRRGAAGRLQTRMVEMSTAQKRASAAASPGALMVIQRGAVEVASAFTAYRRAHNLGKPSTGKTRSPDSAATRAGQEAGDSMRISGGAALGAEARRLGAVVR